MSIAVPIEPDMGDSSDELEPLFDYRRVQPVNFVDLEDSDSDSDSKRRRISKSANNKQDAINGEGKSVEVIDCDDIDEKENWLPPPPPPPPNNVAPSSKLHDEATIKELRRKKLELATLVQSLQAAEEAANVPFSPSFTEGTKETSEPASDRTKIVISIQDKNVTKQYRIFADERFEQLFKKYARKANIDVHKLVFSFDGEKVDPASTPKDLDMEDDDLIEVHVKAT
ncbi:uncharacterized protein LOC130821155 [Amaranthus tricolor]|uniref:uncharacterized protein LOC130821155 n=1 Tax=Amaranthus tricolor TaxID=29722 RepID=UPI002590296E|nr:uncharacterized protein LOC130821155 [Amaranthus tricolor]